MTITRVDIPVVDDNTREYWEAAKEGKLLIKRCQVCMRAHHYPRPFCPYCWSQDVRWEEASGRAVLYTFSIVQRNDLAPFSDRVPYVAAIVDLEEGPRMMTDIVDVVPEEVRIGMDLRVTFVETAPDVSIPMFRPA